MKKLCAVWEDFKCSSFYHWLNVDEVYLEKIKNIPELVEMEKKVAIGRWIGFWCYVGCIICFFSSALMYGLRVVFLAPENPLFFVLNAAILTASLCFSASAVIAFWRGGIMAVLPAICLVIMSFMLMLPFDLQIWLMACLGYLMHGFVLFGIGLGALIALMVVWLIYQAKVKNSKA